MAKVAANLDKTPRWMQWVKNNTGIFVPVCLICLLGVIIVPLPPFMMDLMIVVNISISTVMLLTAVYVRSVLEFSVFPSLLLVATLFRLVLNIASTRLILSADATSPQQVVGVAGEVIEAFSGFVAGGNIVVGVIIFIILIVVQFVVITKGATRVSEVAARFVLDGMPGKQMAIDADLNAGLIDEGEARKRRDQISDEADFYGAMDGASKFVRGDAIAGIIITCVNIIGGIAIGVFYKGWAAGEALESFTKLTIGDGLVSQIPSFIISIAAGLIVTRSGTKEDLGSELTGQIMGQPVALGITAGFLGVLAFTGLPAVPMLAMASVVGAGAWFLRRDTKRVEAVAAAEAASSEEGKDAAPPVEKMLSVDTLELEIGFSLVRLVQESQGGDLLDRISKLRQQIAMEMGFVVPPVRIRDNINLQPNEYHIKIRGNAVAKNMVFPEKFLAMNSGLASGELVGDKTKEPAFGLDAWWIDPSQKQRAETMNYIVADSSSVLATHLEEVVKNYAEEMLTREETNALVEQLKEKSPNLVEEVIPEMIKPGELQKVLGNLLHERVPIRDLETIVETLSDWVGRTRDIEVLTEYVRNALRRTICNQYAELDAETGVSRLHCVTLDPGLEDLINGYIERGANGTTMTVPPTVANRIVNAVSKELSKMISAGYQPLILASPQVRSQVRQLLESQITNVVVMGYNEVSKGVEVESLGLVVVDLSADASGGVNVNHVGADELQGVGT